MNFVDQSDFNLNITFSKSELRQYKASFKIHVMDTFPQHLNEKIVNSLDVNNHKRMTDEEKRQRAKNHVKQWHVLAECGHIYEELNTQFHFDLVQAFSML